MIIKTDDGRRIKCDEDGIKKGWASPFEVWGKLWNETKLYWAKEKNLFYANDCEIESRK